VVKKFQTVSITCRSDSMGKRVGETTLLLKPLKVMCYTDSERLASSHGPAFLRVQTAANSIR
jgi:hypothetical protein